MSERAAVTRELASGYRVAGRADKSRILDELVELTGWHRDYARAALRQALGQALRPVPLGGRRRRKPRRLKYGPRVVAGLVVCWRVLRCPAGKRLAPMLPRLVPLLRRDGDLALDDAEAGLLMGMSAATIDRRLAGERARLGVRGRSHTKPGSLLKDQIPVRTWADWDEAVPGFVEIDLVGHDGGHTSGQFCYTLTVTDVATGWTINQSVPNKARRWVVQALDHALARFPFPVLGIDSDNGTEFINNHLLAYCQDHRITFTRSRPQNKNDGCHVEQKNWARVRELVGYLRFDTPTELELLNQIWGLDAIFANYLLPQQKLVFKQRRGAHVTKRHDTATTPHQRAAAHPEVSKLAVAAMTTRFTGIKPAALARQIQTLTSRLGALAMAKKAPRTTTNLPVQPEVST